MIPLTNIDPYSIFLHGLPCSSHCSDLYQWNDHQQRPRERRQRRAECSHPRLPHHSRRRIGRRRVHHKLRRIHRPQFRDVGGESDRFQLASNQFRRQLDPEHGPEQPLHRPTCRKQCPRFRLVFDKRSSRQHLRQLQRSRPSRQYSGLRSTSSLGPHRSENNVALATKDRSPNSQNRSVELMPPTVGVFKGHAALPRTKCHCPANVLLLR